MSKILVLVHRNGTRHYYSNWKSFTQSVDRFWVRLNLTTGFKILDTVKILPNDFQLWRHIGKRRDWILEDYLGKVIHPDYVLSLYPRRRRKHFGMSGRKRSKGGYYAPSNQTQEYKANITARELSRELDISISARFRSNLPNPWNDERGRSCYGDRSWKRHRKKRWKDSTRC